MSRKITQEIFNNIIKNKYGDRYTILDPYTRTKDRVRIKCNSCGFVFTREAGAFTSKRSNVQCPYCNPTLVTPVVQGANDIWTTHPEIAKLLKNPQDGYTHKICSKLDYVCPKCGHVKHMQGSQILYDGFGCRFCSHGVTYPNRLMGNLLDILKIPFIPEYRIAGYNYRYDFYFELNNKKYIVEMDGNYGHGARATRLRTPKEQIETDNKKDDIASKNGITLIRIDCKYVYIRNRFSYIKKNILSSNFKTITNVASDQIDLANKKSESSLELAIVNDWNNGIHTYDILAKKYHMKNDAIRERLKLASENGLIEMTYDQIKEEAKKNYSIKWKMSRGKPLYCNELKMVFRSASEADTRLGLNTICSNIYRYFNGTMLYCGKLSDGTKLTWKRITKEEYEILKNKEKEKLVS